MGKVSYKEFMMLILVGWALTMWWIVPVAVTAWWIINPKSLGKFWGYLTAKTKKTEQ